MSIQSYPQLRALTWHTDPDDPNVAYAWTFSDEIDPWDPTTDSLYEYDVYRRVGAGDGKDVSFFFEDAQDCFPLDDDDKRPADAEHTPGRYICEIKANARWSPETLTPNELDEDWNNSNNMYIYSMVVKDEHGIRVLDTWIWESWSYRLFVARGDENRRQWVHAGPFESRKDAEAALFDGSYCPSDDEIAEALGVRASDVRLCIDAIEKRDGAQVWKLDDRLLCTKRGDILHPDAKIVADRIGSVFLYGDHRHRHDLCRAYLLWGDRTGDEIPLEPWMMDRNREKPYVYDDGHGGYTDVPPVESTT